MTNQEPIDRDDLLTDLRMMLSAPVREETALDGTVVLVGGDPGEVIVRVGVTKMSVSLFTVRWDGPYTPIVRPLHYATLSWRRLPASTLMMTLRIIIDSAIEMRLIEYRKCERCEKMKPPEWMHSETTCQSCAEQYLGVVH
jgi:hypothetical protein